MIANTIDRQVSIAPMMDHTDKHFRYFMRLLSKKVVLYTEMITSGALIHGDRKRFLDFNDIEHPLAIQLGGSVPDDLAQCASMAEDEGYDEVNLNIGCPSDRVQNGQFGACLMGNAQLVADCVARIKSKVTIPVTVKTRIGIDDQDSYDFLYNFIETVSAAGCDTFITHARKAILSGLSPKENREIPPLHYDRVYRLKQDFPALHITINGGITELSEVQEHLQQVDGVMLGRVAYQNPYCLADIDREIYQEKTSPRSRYEIVKEFREYLSKQIQLGINPKSLTRHIIGLYQGQAGAKQYRRLLSEARPENNQDLRYLDEIIELISA